MYISNCALWSARPSTNLHQNISRTAASRCPIRHVEPVSGRHLAVCWTSREHVLSSASVNVLSPLLDLRHGTHYPSTWEGLHLWTRSSSYSRHTCSKYRFRCSLTVIVFSHHSIILSIYFIFIYFYTYVRRPCFYLRMSYSAIQIVVLLLLLFLGPLAQRRRLEAIINKRWLWMAFTLCWTSLLAQFAAVPFSDLMLLSADIRKDIRPVESSLRPKCLLLGTGHLTLCSNSRKVNRQNKSQKKTFSVGRMTSFYRAMHYVLLFMRAQTEQRHLLNQHVSSNLGRRHVSNLQQELCNPVSDDWKQCHEVFDYLRTQTDYAALRLKRVRKLVTLQKQRQGKWMLRIVAHTVVTERSRLFYS